MAAKCYVSDPDEGIHLEDRLSYADTLLAAHRGGPSPDPAVSPPTDYASAMQVQREVTRVLGATVAGWKIGFSPDGVPVAGPLYASVVQAAPASVPLPDRGFIVEIELAFRLARDLPRRPYTRDEILDALDEALIGIELIAGRRGEPPAVPYLAFLADNIGNAGYVTGASTRGFRALDLKALPMRFSVDGQVVQERLGGHPQGDPVEPLRAYASQPNDELGGLRKGQVITTGSLTKPLRLGRAARIDASLAAVGGVSLDLTR
jgi:2-keto-4-pentenoate hydratase